MIVDRMRRHEKSRIEQKSQENIRDMAMEMVKKEVLFCSLLFYSIPPVARTYISILFTCILDLSWNLSFYSILTCSILFCTRLENFASYNTIAENETEKARKLLQNIKVGDKVGELAEQIVIAESEGSSVLGGLR